MEKFFETEEELARGVQGVVRLCTHTSTGHRFACKSTSFDASSSSTRSVAAREALSEVAALAILSTHPNIVSLFAHFEEPSAIHVILELCSGGNLFHHLSKRETDLIGTSHSQQIIHHGKGCTDAHSGAASRELSTPQSLTVDPGSAQKVPTWPLTEFEAAQIFAASLRAVSHCHDHGIMHGDIKLENLLLPQQGCSYEDIKLADFGLASRFWSAKGGRKEVWGMQGTLPYIAPETLKDGDKGTYDEKADIWSLGVLLYILLCGKYPFQGNKPEEVLEAMRILKSPSWEQSFESPLASSLARDLLKKMLHLNPLKRSSARSLLKHPWLQEHALTGQVPISRASERLRESLLDAFEAALRK